MGKYPFQTLSEAQDSGVSPTVSWAAGTVSSPLPEPWGGWSQFLANLAIGYLGYPGEGLEGF